MLPLPGSPAATWRKYHQALRSAADAGTLRIAAAFWLFGLINNIFYVVILTSALDLVGPSIPKATVLLASIIPGLSTKIVVPYVIDLLPYHLRTIILAFLSTCGMLAVALSPNTTDARSIISKIAGIVLANISSGAGEVNFLGLTHFYGATSLSAWSSGTGGAGLIGAGAYTLATTTLGFSVHAVLLSSTILSIVLLTSYFVILPLEPLRNGKRPHYQRVETEDDGIDPPESEDGLHQTVRRITSPAYRHNRSKLMRAWRSLQEKLLRARLLMIPYMLPLFLVYLAEYTINQGVAPTLLFPLDESPFKRFREFYPTYGTIYQLGVFISRSSLPFVRVRSLYIPSLLQVLNLVALTAHSMHPFIPAVWYVFAIIVWEGLLGGLVYVSTFAAIREEVAEEDREFSLGATTVSDSAGIFFAGLLGTVMETSLCTWQVNHGRKWCKQL